jgi:RNA polymerase sigma factor (sigma-70 family)
MKSRITQGSRFHLSLRRHLPLVKATAARVRGNIALHPELDDLVAEGLLGLEDAAERYTPRKNVHFRTYAKQCIRGAILDSLKKRNSATRLLRSRKPGSAIEKPAGTLYEAELNNEFGMTLLHLQKALADGSSQVINRREKLHSVAEHSARVRLLADPQVVITGHIVDITPDGMKLSLPGTIPAGSVLEVEFQNCVLLAKVIYCLLRPKSKCSRNWWIGIQFAHRPWALVEPKDYRRQMTRPKPSLRG